MQAFEIKQPAKVAEIVEKIKDVNSQEWREGQTIAQDDSNEEIKAILADYGLEDDPEQIEAAFGVGGLHSIRDAENGAY